MKSCCISKYNRVTLLVFACIMITVTPTVVQGRQPLKIRKCCPLTEVIDIRRMKCRDSGENYWSPTFYKDTQEPFVDGGGASVGYEIVTRIPTCPPGIGVHILPLRDIPGRNLLKAEFRILKDGRLVGKHSKGNWIDIPENSCIDGIMNYGGPDPYTGEERDQAIISCPVIEERSSI